MKYRNIMNISLQQIQIFLKCCQYQNYSRVAEEYNFTPSMVSKTIKNLENLLGIPLFIRKYHRLELTPAGRELEKGWKNLSQDLIETITRAFDVQEQLSAHIRIGVLETTRFCADYVTMKLEENLVDLIITWSGETPYLNSKISGWKKIFVSPDAVFIPRGHPLYNAPLTSFSECRAYPFISLSPATYPHYYQYKERKWCREHFSRLHFLILLLTSSLTTGNQPNARCEYRCRYPHPCRLLSQHISDSGPESPLNFQFPDPSFRAAAHKPEHKPSHSGGHR